MILKNKNGNLSYNGFYTGVRYYKGKLYAPLDGRMCEVSSQDDYVWSNPSPSSFTHKEWKQLKGVIYVN